MPNGPLNCAFVPSASVIPELSAMPASVAIVADASTTRIWCFAPSAT